MSERPVGEPSCRHQVSSQPWLASRQGQAPGDPDGSRGGSWDMASDAPCAAGWPSWVKERTGKAGRSQADGVVVDPC